MLKEVGCLCAVMLGVSGAEESFGDFTSLRFGGGHFSGGGVGWRQ